MAERISILEIHKLAKVRGGQCLSENYINNRIPLLWQCSHGHTWQANLSSVKNQNTWCPTCIHLKPLTIEEMQTLAASMGGECLSKAYVNTHSPLTWKCQLGHVWRSKPVTVKYGPHWCPSCSKNKKMTIGEMRRLAKARGGKCLSEKYINSKTHLQWQCAKGHVWFAIPESLKINKTWCLACSGQKKLTIEMMRDLAKSRGGKCLSMEYINSGTPLQWQCALGHTWSSAPDGVKNSGNWCSICYHASRRKGAPEQVHDTIVKELRRSLRGSLRKDAHKFEKRLNKNGVFIKGSGD